MDPDPMTWCPMTWYWNRALILISLLSVGTGLQGIEIVVAATPDVLSPRGELQFETDVKPILAEYCFGCHADGASEGSMSFDALLATADREAANERWHHVLKQLQAGTMPPADEDRPSDEQSGVIASWIKYGAFGLDPDDPDPGHVTMRRLNQVEYRNTVRDLLGVEYDTAGNFPADDTGHGFDNIGDVLSLSPLMLEKYVNAAKEIVTSVVPLVPGVVRQRAMPGDHFKLDLVSIAASADDAAQASTEEPQNRGRGRGFGGRGGPTQAAPGTIELSYYKEAVARAVLSVEVAGDYTLRLNLRSIETYVDNVFDENRCEFTFSLGDEQLVKESFVRQGGKDYTYDFDRHFEAAGYDLTATVKPLSEAEQIRNLRLQIVSVDLIGPQDERYYDKPAGHERFFPGGVPDGADARCEYARELLRSFATRAFRRPVDDDHLDRLVELAESVYADGSDSFESGIAKSMTATLASPRFLFREESIADPSDTRFPLIDEYSLASRLSYFLWSSMPDEALMQLAEAGTLRQNLDSQIDRMLQDERSRALAENFVGQWLRSRAIDSVQINSRAVLSREPRSNPESDVRRQRFFELFRKGEQRSEAEQTEYLEAREAFRQSFGRGPRLELTSELRTAMRRETEMLFEHIINHDRSLLEIVDSDYTFLNEDLWNHYEIKGVDRVEGDEMRWVQLPANSVRGGVLTHGTVLAVTSNPDRTSPVKRGLFILENLLGTPPPAPPPNIPALEDVTADEAKKLTLRETLAIHRENALCSSCHNRMDPLGLALENFNALGRFRDMEMDQTIDASGTLGPGQAFSNVGELKKILVTEHQEAIYRCMTEKLMTFALGRAVEYSDAHTIDSLVDKLLANEGRAGVLLRGLIHSSAFQRTRGDDPNAGHNHTEHLSSSSRIKR